MYFRPKFGPFLHHLGKTSDFTISRLMEQISTLCHQVKIIL
jgi:hypothetical protein